MLRLTSLAIMAAVFSTGFVAHAEEAGVLDHKVKSIDGKEINLEDYKGKVLLVVNVASKCGYTKQYAGLEDLQKKLGSKGFAVLGFPCNQFGKQEPGTEEEIKEFCEATYKVTFDMFSKVDVNGANADPFYKEITQVDAKPKGAGDVKWNFEKFVIGKDGSVIARFPSSTTPEDKELLSVIEKALAAN